MFNSASAEVVDMFVNFFYSERRAGYLGWQRQLDTIPDKGNWYTPVTHLILQLFGGYMIHGEECKVPHRMGS